MKTIRTLFICILFVVGLSFLFLVPVNAQTIFDCSDVTEIPQAECEALVALYNSTNGDDWINKTGWLQSTQPCRDWFGISCSAGQVATIELPTNHLLGSLPLEIGSLVNLHTLYLSNNELTGEIPYQLGELGNLWELDLSSNFLTGRIPNRLGDLPELNLLSLNNNQLTGKIPTELSNIKTLEFLTIQNNQLNGNIPQSFVNLPFEIFKYANTNLCEPGNTTFQYWLVEIPILTRTGITCPPADLSIEILEPQDPVEIGQFFEYVIQISNGTVGYATGVNVIFFLDGTSIQINSAVSSQGECNFTGGMCHLGDLAEGSIAFIHLEAVAVDSGSSNLSVSAHGDDTDPNESNNSAVEDTTVFSFSCSAVIEIPVSECEALVALYNSTDGDNWIDNTNWLQRLRPGTWHGVSVSGGHVDGLYLHSNQLNGIIPPELGDLVNLFALHLFNNQLTGNIPQDFVNLSLENFMYENTELCEPGNDAFQNWLAGIPSLTGTGITCPPADLNIMILEQQDPLAIDQSFEYILEISNGTIGYATGVKIAFSLDGTSIQINSAVSTQGVCETTSGECQLGEIAEGKTVYVILKAITVEMGASLLTATVNGDDTDPNESNNSDTIDTTVTDLYFSCSYMTEIPQAECEALVALYNSTDGDNWVDNTNWLQNQSPSTWHGVAVSGGHIVGLHLQSNQLNGSVPPEIGNLISSSELDLSNNQLSGSIPPEIGNLINLFGLHLNNNQLSGSIPPEIGDLINLHFLYLNNNQLSGSISPEIGNLINLFGLHLNDNQLSGSIPPEIGNLINLFELHLDYNQLSGSIPPELGNLANLGGLYLNNNHLSGEIPFEIVGFRNFVFTDLGYNHLISTNQMVRDKLATRDPDWESTQSPGPFCSYVTEIPFLECEALVALYNNTTGESWTNNDGWLQTLTPCSWHGVTCDGTHIATINLNNNQLNGTIPSELGNLVNLQGLFLAINNLSGEIPSSISVLSNLQTLNLSFNQLSGEIPTISNDLISLEYIYLQSNQLIGNIPVGLGNLVNLKGLSLQNNKLTGSIPSDLGKLVNLETLFLSDNQLIGDIPSGFVNLTNLKNLYLHNNQLSGNIPSSLGSLSNLKNIYLYNNQLIGEIPPQLGDLSNLQYLYLQNNHLSGNIPATLGALSNLKYLNISYNQLTGGIPIELGNLANLISLALANNQITGSLPPELGSLTNLYYMYLNNNPLNGSLPLSLSNLDLLYMFNFSGTGLCEPNNAAFQEWLTGITYLTRNGETCPPVDLAVEVSGPTAPVEIGQPVEYLLTISNGTATIGYATGVNSTYTLDETILRVDEVYPSQGECALTTETCDLGDLAVGATATIRIEATTIDIGLSTLIATVSGNDPDPNENNNSASVDTIVAPSNTPPIAQDDMYGVVVSTTLDVPAPGLLSNDNDEDGNPLTAHLATGTSLGVLTVDPDGDGSFTYEPVPEYVGEISFTYYVNDGWDDSDLATVKIYVGPDIDGDGIIPPLDNCPTGYNPEQEADDCVITEANSPDITDISLIDITEGMTQAAIEFEVIQAGTTSLRTVTDGVEPPYGFKLGNSSLYYEIGTTVEFTGMATVCIGYNETDFKGPEKNLSLWHLENGGWKKLPNAIVNEGDNIICAETTSFSPFAIFEPNLPPTISGISAPDVPIELGNSVEVSGIFADLNEEDVHTATWSWGDGSQSEGAVTYETGIGMATGSHTYEVPGVFVVTLNLEDNDGGIASQEYYFLVVYDPEGGFVTGGGWIDSPEGAYVSDPSLNGKSTFGFVSKYIKGTTIPTGNTEFQFKVADLNFHSTEYQWLVVAGSKAMFKGVGTINGQGNYGFLISAIDEQLTSSTNVDLFRIKIWDIDNGDTVVYDNLLGESENADPATTLGGGSIVIHKAK